MPKLTEERKIDRRNELITSAKVHLVSAKNLRDKIATMHKCALLHILISRAEAHEKTAKEYMERAEAYEKTAKGYTERAEDYRRRSI